MKKCGKALAEIYTMHSFAPFLESIIENWGKRPWPKQPRKGENERPLSSSTLLRTLHRFGIESQNCTVFQSYFFVKNWLNC